MITKEDFFKYHFSPKLTLGALFLSAIMLVASSWQWTRYHEKLDLVEAYHNHEKSKPVVLEAQANVHLDLAPFLHKKIKISGHFDFDSQVAISNRRHAKGFGHWLMTSFAVQNSEDKILVSRGFIPYEDRERDSWRKYDKESNEVVGVVQKGVSKRSSFSPSASMVISPDLFLYPDLYLIRDKRIAGINTDYYIQSISDPVMNGFPSTDISIDVPPSTHFWYTFEWIGLSSLTLLISLFIQIFRPNKAVHKLTYILFLLPYLNFDNALALSDPSIIDQKAGITEHLGDFIDPSLEFTDEEGQKITLESVLTKGLPVVIAPVYFECPRLCSFTQAGLIKTINKIRSVPNKDFIALSISFNAKEGFEIAKNRSVKYREQLERRDDFEKQGWKFLVGEESKIQTLLSAIGFRYEYDKGEFMHAAGLIFISPKGKIVRYLYGIEFPTRDFDLAVSEASEGKIGSFLNKAMIFCFRYDHLKGQYTLAIWSIIQAVSIISVIFLILYLIILKFREKKSV